MNERLNPPLQLEQVINTITAIVPRDWQHPLSYYGEPETNMLFTLLEVSREIPALESLAAATVKEEAHILQSDHARDISRETYRSLSEATKYLPTIPSTITHEPLINRHDLSLFYHDTGLQYVGVLTR